MPSILCRRQHRVCSRRRGALAAALVQAKTGCFEAGMGRRLEAILAHGIDEADFLAVSEPVLWIRLSGGNLSVGLPDDVLGWPDGGSVNKLTDQFQIIGRSRGKSFRVQWDHYFPLDLDDLEGIVEVSAELFSAYLVRRAMMICRLARFYRGVSRIEERAKGKTRALKAEQTHLEEVARRRRLDSGLAPPNPTYRVTTLVRQEKLSVFQARVLASTGTQQLMLVRVREDGSLTANSLTFKGEQRFGKWRPGEAQISNQCFVVMNGSVSERDVSESCHAELMTKLSPASTFLDPANLPKLMSEVARHQNEADRASRKQTSMSEREKDECAEERRRLSRLCDLRVARNSLRIRRNRVQSAVRRTYDRRAQRIASRLMNEGWPVEQREGLSPAT